MNITFTSDELAVIQLMVPEMTPEETCDKVLHDWYASNLPRMKTQIQTQDEITANILSTNSAQLDTMKKIDSSVKITT